MARTPAHALASVVCPTGSRRPPVMGGGHFLPVLVTWSGGGLCFENAAASQKGVRGRVGCSGIQEGGEGAGWAELCCFFLFDASSQSRHPGITRCWSGPPSSCGRSHAGWASPVFPGAAWSPGSRPGSVCRDSETYRTNCVRPCACGRQRPGA